MSTSYEKGVQPDKAGPRELLATDGREHLLPVVNIFALAFRALDQVIDVIGRAAIEAVQEISATEVAGHGQPRQRRDGDDAVYDDHQGRQSMWQIGLAGSRSHGCEALGRGRDSRLRAAQAAVGAGGADARAALGRLGHAVRRQGCRRDGRGRAGRGEFASRR